MTSPARVRQQGGRNRGGPSAACLPALVIFDCDGVLIDSESQSRAVIIAAAAECGWTIGQREAARFTGLRWSDLQDDFERGCGHALPPDWLARLQHRAVEAMRAGVKAMQGAHAAIEAVQALGIAVRVASNSSHEEMAVKFGQAGLADLVAGRVHSARDVGVGKPDPAVFLAAAAAEGVAPSACLVVEDSQPGVRAALAAGMACLVLGPVEMAGARRITSLSDVVLGLEEAIDERSFLKKRRNFSLLQGSTVGQ